MEEKEEKQKLIQKYKEAMRYEHCSLFLSYDPNGAWVHFGKNSAALYTPTSFLPFLLLPSTVYFVTLGNTRYVSGCNAVPGVRAKGLRYDEAWAAGGRSPMPGALPCSESVSQVVLCSCVGACQVSSLLDLQ